MSKIGKKPIQIPAGVKIEVESNQVKVTGPKGALLAPIFDEIKIVIKDSELRVERTKDSKQARSYHGLVRSLINNHIIGVTEGYKVSLKLVGTGYRVKKKGQGIEMAIGFSHPVEFAATLGVTLDVEGEDTIHVLGIDKQAVGQVAADIRASKPPEPYGGKGVRYEDEVVKIKPGKAAAE